MTDAIVRALWRMWSRTATCSSGRPPPRPSVALGDRAPASRAACGPRSSWRVAALLLGTGAATRGARSSPLADRGCCGWRAGRSRGLVAAAPPIRAGAALDRARAPLRRIARKTWRFFETFVTAEDHWLAPDNYQEDPKGEVAPTHLADEHRVCSSSPT